MADFKKKEKEALRSYCRLMLSRVRHKQQHPEEKQQQHEEDSVEEVRWKNKDGRGGHETGERRGRRPASPGLMCQGPEVQAVPLQLISRLRLQTLEEDMRRAAEVELHDPAVCSMCEQEQASLALRSFIWRKKTQLQMKTWKDRLNMQLSHKHGKKLDGFIM